MEQYKKPYKPEKDFKKKPFKKKEEEKFDVDKWLKQHQNIETPKRGKKNSLGDKKIREDIKSSLFLLECN